MSGVKAASKNERALEAVLSFAQMGSQSRFVPP
jgi:hypothetical protein